MNGIPRVIKKFRDPEFNITVKDRITKDDVRVRSMTMPDIMDTIMYSKPNKHDQLDSWSGGIPGNMGGITEITGSGSAKVAGHNPDGTSYSYNVSDGESFLNYYRKSFNKPLWTWIAEMKRLIKRGIRSHDEENP